MTLALSNTGVIKLIVPADGIVHIRDDKGQPFVLAHRFEAHAFGLPYEGMRIWFNSDQNSVVSDFVIETPIFSAHRIGQNGPQ